MIVIIDGRIDFSADTTAAADEARLEGIAVFAVGVGEYAAASINGCRRDNRLVQGWVFGPHCLLSPAGTLPCGDVLRNPFNLSRGHAKWRSRRVPQKMKRIGPSAEWETRCLTVV